MLISMEIFGFQTEKGKMHHSNWLLNMFTIKYESTATTLLTFFEQCNAISAQKILFDIE